ncbi:MAG: HAMP domain-containing histidine kinase, partial [Deltaproteobacteria bacterium]|nr:HAMP domain-containing histidine kinase [Deltaproteobacteria bacterium]
EESFLAKTGLQFFGRMSASVTHEIKNVLAIINENAGLLEDIVLMAEKGLDVSPERLQRMARTVGAQVGRADAVVKMMNHFSHSIDHFVEPVDLTQVAEDVCDLFDRLLQMREVTLETIASPAPVVVTASRFYLQNLLWCCLDWATRSRSEKRTISLAPEEMDNGKWITVHAFGLPVWPIWIKTILVCSHRRRKMLCWLSLAPGSLFPLQTGR